MNFCRELHSVLFCAWGNKRAQHAESRRAVHLRGDVPLLHLRVAEFCLVLCWMKAALGSDQWHQHRVPHGAHRCGAESCALPVECAQSGSKPSSPAPCAPRPTLAKCLSTETYHMLFV